MNLTAKQLKKAALKLGHRIKEGKKHTLIYGDFGQISTVPPGRIKPATVAAILRQLGLIAILENNSELRCGAAVCHSHESGNPGRWILDQFGDDTDMDPGSSPEHVPHFCGTQYRVGGRRGAC